MSQTKTGQYATIVWPAPGGCLPHFPGLHDLENYRASYEANDQLVPFLEEIKKAVNRLWIIDKNFLQKKPEQDGIDTICEAVKVSNVKEIKIITMTGGHNSSTPEDAVKRLKKARRNFRTGQDRLPIGICTKLTKQTSSLIHDRFAIIDNLLWHFGSDVGGRDTALNAVSLGWDANTTNAGSFFLELWNKLGCDPVRREKK